MVRHEAAEALGAIAEPACLQLLTDYCEDPDAIVADSCVVSVLSCQGLCSQPASGSAEEATASA